MAAFFSEHSPKGEHGGVKSTPRVGNSDAPRRFFDSAKEHQFADLTLDELAMVEAEMIHQGILPAVNDDLRGGAGILTFAASHEANLYIWYARRAGFAQAQLIFKVNLPALITERLHALNAAESPNLSRLLEFVRLDSTARSQLPRKLEVAYLNRFADFLIANREHGTNRYQRGLNVVLKTLLRPRRQSYNSEKLEIVLPTTRTHVLQMLKAERLPKKL